MGRDIRNVLFDLDGTLVDSSRTIAACIEYALDRVGVKSVCSAPINSMIGTPLLEIFRDRHGLSQEAVDAAIDHYRAHYDALRQEGSRVYPDIHAVLSNLQERGLRLFVATVKPAPIADRVLTDLRLRPYFDGVAGSSMDHRRRTKGGIIAHGLRTWGLDPSRTLMVGDRDQDIEGARENGLRSIGVSYGFGSKEELQAANPDHLVTHPAEIPPIFAL
jgi:phosphoglycolate phosphatase